MGRYKLHPTKKLFNGKIALQTTHYPVIPKRSSDVYLVSDIGDRLDLLSKEYYGRADLWWIIACANNLGKGSLRLDSGIYFRVPTEIEPIIREFNKLNNI